MEKRLNFFIWRVACLGLASNAILSQVLICKWTNAKLVHYDLLTHIAVQSSRANHIHKLAMMRVRKKMFFSSLLLLTSNQFLTFR